MCIVFWTVEHQDYALILCTNRDEYLDRPTKAAHFHSFEHEADERHEAQGFILSGIDEFAGGTWFGLSRTGRVALLTNITEQAKPIDTSRGTLVSSFLLASSSDLHDVGNFVPRDAKFAGFNLLLFAPVQATSGLRFEASFVSNGGAGGNLNSRPLSPDEKKCGGFSNGVDGNGGGDWPKVRYGVQEFASILQQVPSEVDEMQFAERLFELLSWRSPEAVTERSHLRNTIQVVPIPIPVSGKSTAASGFYGTRLSTVLLIRNDGQVFFVERDIWKLVDGKVTKDMRK